MTGLSRRTFLRSGAAAAAGVAAGQALALPEAAQAATGALSADVVVVGAGLCRADGGAQPRQRGQVGDRARSREPGRRADAQPLTSAPATSPRPAGSSSAPTQDPRGARHGSRRRHVRRLRHRQQRLRERAADAASTPTRRRSAPPRQTRCCCPTCCCVQRRLRSPRPSPPSAPWTIANAARTTPIRWRPGYARTRSTPTTRCPCSLGHARRCGAASRATSRSSTR